MKAPWSNQTGLAKWIAMSATALGISLGLCGLNLASFSLVGWSGSHASHSGQSRITDHAGAFLMDAAYAEALAIIVSAVLLVLLIVIWVIREVFMLVRKD